MDEHNFRQEVRTITADLQRLAAVGQTHAREVAVRMFSRMDATTHPLEFGIACLVAVARIAAITTCM